MIRNKVHAAPSERTQRTWTIVSDDTHGLGMDLAWIWSGGSGMDSEWIWRGFGVDLEWIWSGGFGADWEWIWRGSGMDLGRISAVPNSLEFGTSDSAPGGGPENWISWAGNRESPESWPRESPEF